MAITITVRDKTPELFQKLEAGIHRFVVKGAAYIEGALKVEGGKSKSGRRYKRGDKIHIASAKGESPATDSANLYPSIETQLDDNMLEAKIGTPVEYAIYLEGGAYAPSTRGETMGPHMGGMEPRPLWEKTARESLPTLEKMLDQELGR